MPTEIGIQYPILAITPEEHQKIVEQWDAAMASLQVAYQTQTNVVATLLTLEQAQEMYGNLLRVSMENVQNQSK